jgi:hypothetical protein
MKKENARIGMIVKAKKRFGPLDKGDKAIIIGIRPHANSVYIYSEKILENHDRRVWLTPCSWLSIDKISTKAIEDFMVKPE